MPKFSPRSFKAHMQDITLADESIVWSRNNNSDQDPIRNPKR